MAVPFGLAVLEIAWLAPWSYLAGVAATGTPLLPPLAMFLMLIASASLAARLVDQEELPERARMAQVAGGLLVALVATRLAPGTVAGWPVSLVTEAIAIPNDGVSLHLLALFGAGGLWWQGILLGRGRPGDRGVASRVGIGVAGLAGAALVERSTALSLHQMILPLAVTVFLVSALLTLTLADLEEVRAGSRDRQARALSRSWLGLVVVAACGLLAIGVVLASLIDRQGLRALQAGAHILLPVVDFLIIAIALPFALAADLLYRLLLFFRRGQHSQPPSPPGQSPFATLRQSGTVSPPPTWLTHMMGIVIALFALLAIIVLLLAALRSFHMLTPEADVPEERRNIWSWADILAPLRRQPRSQSEADETVDAVRAAYRRFLALAASSGQARACTETALEYCQRLQRAGPTDSEAIEQLTARYQHVRYGPDGVTAGDAAAAEAALARLQQGLYTDSRANKDPAAPLMLTRRSHPRYAPRVEGGPRPRR